MGGLKIIWKTIRVAIVLIRYDDEEKSLNRYFMSSGYCLIRPWTVILIAGNKNKSDSIHSKTMLYSVD